VISGKFKGKPLYAPKGKKVRPTTDRVKETLFSILFSKGAALDGKALDLFAGSGALGIEALSRGAIECFFVDVDQDSIALAKKNLTYVGASSSSYKVYRADYKKALGELAGNKFDIIFIDPPFNSLVELSSIEGILSNDLLCDYGIIVIEHDVRHDLLQLKQANLPLEFETRTLGNTCLTFVTKEPID